MHYLTLFFISLLFIGCSSSKTPLPLFHTVDCSEKVYALKSAQCLENKEFIEHLEPYSIIFIGDHHSSKKLHNHTAQIIHDLSKKGYRIHLANEWFTPQDNDILAKYASGYLNDGNFTKLIDWEKKRSFRFDLYSPLYHSIRDTKGELYGINLSKKEQKLISDVNINNMSSKEKIFFDSLDLSVSIHQRLLSPFFGYCHKQKADETKQECITRMYRVQVAWDTKMGQESALLAKKVLKTDKDKLIVFIGSMHLSHKVGVNLRFARESKIPFVTLLPQLWRHNVVLHGEADFIYLYKREEASKKIEKELVKEIKTQR